MWVWSFKLVAFWLHPSMAFAAPWLRPGAPYGRILAYGRPCPTLGRYPYAGPDLRGDILTPPAICQSTEPVTKSTGTLNQQAPWRVELKFRRDSSIRPHFGYAFRLAVLAVSQMPKTKLALPVAARNQLEKALNQIGQAGLEPATKGL